MLRLTSVDITLETEPNNRRAHGALSFIDEMEDISGESRFSFFEVGLPFFDVEISAVHHILEIAQYPHPMTDKVQR